MLCFLTWFNVFEHADIPRVAMDPHSSYPPSPPSLGSSPLSWAAPEFSLTADVSEPHTPSPPSSRSHSSSYQAT
ncbi:hypothetical protein BDN72DRAFT_473315 [Pluteus cervinus]|uniref:Uncharacterized protein n=1 Tax=Pluteus cervinus TaxID=181527 RepID=A0ACD3A6C4_9AGAR|nr:hypothetical protein BDN72DRAFT_473315 [Pluteus cervinus]